MQNPVSAIVKWYAREGRSLPWRESKDPYRVWLSEVILQQTRIDQGIGYYHRFLNQFPTVHHLANADQETVMKAWEGLGYYARARNLHSTAQFVSTSLGGNFPNNYSELEKLKGIGPYTARAIGSIAFGNRVGVVDGNVQRVLSRYLGNSQPIDLPATRKHMQALLDQWLAEQEEAGHDGKASEFNQGLMDLGSMICKHLNPACDVCPLGEVCEGRRLGLQSELPVKSGKLKRKVQYLHAYLIWDGGGKLLIQKRPTEGLWGGLWEIPMQEVKIDAWAQEKQEGGRCMGEFKHVLTHIDMMIAVYAMETFEKRVEDQGVWVEVKDLGNYAFSRAVSKIFERFLSRKS